MQTNKNEILKRFEVECRKNEVWISTFFEEPHLAPVCFVKVIDDKIVIANNFLTKTVSNLKKNPQIALGVVFLDKEGYDGYMVKGKAEIYESGEYFEKMKEYVLKRSKGRREPRSVIVVDVEKIYSLKPGFGKKRII